MSLTVLTPDAKNDTKDTAAKLRLTQSTGLEDTYYFTLSAPGAFVGATVSAIVYTTLSTTGEIAASATGTGIELGGNLIAYGTEFAIGSIPAQTVRMAAKTYSALAKPTISNTSRLGALGISVIVGAGAALTTSAVIYGSKQIGSYLYSCIEEYKHKVAQKIQHSIEPEITLLLLKDIDDDDLQIIEEEDPTHSPQDL